MTPSIFNIIGTWKTGLPASDFADSGIAASLYVDGDMTILAVETLEGDPQYVVKNDFGHRILLGSKLPPLPKVQQQLATIQDRLFTEQGGNNEELYKMIVGTIKMDSDLDYAEQTATEMNEFIMDFTSDTITDVFFLEKSEDELNYLLCWYYEDPYLNEERFLTLRNAIYDELLELLPEDTVYGV